MVALGVGLVWLGYAAGLYGYCLIRGYDISPMQIFGVRWPPGVYAAPKPTAGA